jgi:hypothetical protein
MLHGLRSRFAADTIIAGSTAIYVVTLLVLAFVKIPILIVLMLIIAGLGWTSTMATLNTSVQLAVPPWVQARVLGAYLMTSQGGLALGSVLWGSIAEHTSTSTSLVSAAIGLAVSYPLVKRFHILRGAMPDFTPYRWKNPAPQSVLDSEPTAGPVRISVTYRIPIENYAAFTRAIHKMRDVRLRDGAMRWGIYRDENDPQTLNETFIMESWLDYLRSRERITASDAAIRDQVRMLHRGDTPPLVSRQIYSKEVTDPNSAT